MRTALSMGIGGSLDCYNPQPNPQQPPPTNGVVTEIWVPASLNGNGTAFYNVAATFAFGPNPDLGPLPPGP
jgi:hypothetical protein